MSKKKSRNKNLIFKIGLMVILILFTKPAKTENIKDLIKQYIKNSISNTTSINLLKKIFTYNDNEILNAIEPYINDTLVAVRSSAIFLVYKTGLKSDNEKTIQQSIKILTEKLDDKDAGIVKMAIEYLKEFKYEYFTPEIKYIISQKAQVRTFHYYDLILLTGYLQIKDLIYNYKKMVEDKKYSMRDRWAMTLAMARMGDHESIEKVMNRVKRLPINDDVVTEIYPDLVYIRTKEAFNWLFNIIMSDDKNCLSSNPDNEQSIICGYRVIELIGKYIEGFPVDIDENGELVIENYGQTIKDVRVWIRDNIYDYNLKGNIY